MSRLVLAANSHINTAKELVAVDKVFNSGDRKTPSDQALKKFIDVYMQVANRVHLGRNNDKKEAIQK